VVSTIAVPSPGSATPTGGAAMIRPDRNTKTSMQIVLGTMVPSVDEPEIRFLRKEGIRPFTSGWMRISTLVA
jgi:hypothetical protein